VRSHTILSLLFAAFPATALSQWTYGSSGTTAELRGLIVVSDQVAWASGTRGSVLRTMDGGRNWTADTVPGASMLDFRSVHALNDGMGLVASAGEAEKGLAAIYATGDGGRHWHRVYATEQKGVFFDALQFWDVRRGIALSDPVDSAFVLMITEDRGGTWNRIPATCLPRVLPGEAAFAASGSSIVLRGTALMWIGTGGGGRARVMRSADAGRTWQVVDVPVHAAGPAAGIFALAFFDDSTGVAVGGDYTQPTLAASSVAITRDGGRSWRPAAQPPAAYLSGVSYAGSRDRLVAVGLAGTFVSSDGGDRWHQVDTVAMNAVRFQGTTGFAVGPRGRVARWTP
jgi:photosystem II stability/assembly factor-like uncharacterized protein